MADLTTWTLVAETCEWVGPIAVTADGDPVTDFEVTVTAPGVRPTAWTSPDAIGVDLGVLVGVGTVYALMPGVKYTVWIRYAADPETPVERVGYIKAF